MTGTTTIEHIVMMTVSLVLSWKEDFDVKCSNTNENKGNKREVAEAESLRR